MRLPGRKSLLPYMIGDKAFYKTVFAILIPIVIQNTVTSFVSLLDNVMVGQLGTEQMSGVAIANQLIFIYNICIFGGTSGASIYGAQFYGAKDYENMRAAMRFKLYVGIGIFLALGAVFLFFDTPLISLFLNDADRPEMVALTLDAGKEYLAVMLVGLLPFALSNAYSSTLREAGETMLPMVSGVAAVITNVLFNYILIFGHFGAPRLGVTGAAIATVISRFVELGIIVFASHRDKVRYFYLQGLYKTWKVPGGLVKRIVVRGLPLLLNETLWSVGMSYLAQLYSVRGLTVVAANNISSTVNNLFNTAVLAMGNAVAIMVGQVLGADDVEGAKKTAWRLICFGLALSLVMGALLAAASPFIPKIYNTTDDVRHLATVFMFILAATMPFLAFVHCCYFTLRSGGKTVMTFLFDCVPIWVVNIPLVYFLVHGTDVPISIIFLINQCVNFFKCCFGAWMVKKGVWIHNIAREAAGAD